MAYNQMVKVHYKCKYLRIIKGAQRINSDVRAKGSANRNLLIEDNT